MIENCKICDSDNISKISLYGTEMISCKFCGVHYLAEFGEKSEIDEYYEKEYRITSEDILESEFRRIFRLPEQIALISEIMNYKPSPGRLIDIGCDKAFFIDEARRYGYDCTGIELSSAAQDYAGKMGIGLKKSLDEAEGRFDISVMWHSLEHLPEPHSFLKELKEHLTPEAFLFIRVPAFDCFWRKLLGRKWIWFQPQNHYFHYSSQSLQNLLIRNGFDIVLIEHRKPNTRETKKMYRLAKAIFARNYGYHTSLRNRLVRFYEDITGIELFVLARLIQDKKGH